jgi:hypothetical protein
MIVIAGKSTLVRAKQADAAVTVIIRHISDLIAPFTMIAFCSGC